MSDELQWQFGEFEPAGGEVAPAGREGRGVRLGLGFLLVLAGLLAYAWWQGEGEPAAGRRGLARELAAGKVEDAPAAVQFLQTPAALGDDLAVLRVQVPGGGEGFAWEETRFYRRGEDGWRRVEPQTRFWGARRQQRSAHFRILYRELDAGAAEALAAQVESRYAATLRRFGGELPAGGPAAGRPFTVEIVPEPDPAMSLAQQPWLRLPSPHLLRLPAGRNPEDVLAWRVGSWVASQVIYEQARLALGVQPELRFMTDCLRQTAAGWWAPPDPTWEQARRRYLAQAVAAEAWLPPAQAGFFLFETRDGRQRGYQCSTVGEFIAERYGAGGFAALVGVAGRHYTWRDVVEQGLGVPYERFLRGWQDFVRARYG